MTRNELSLVVVEYANGKIAVQAIQGNQEAAQMFDDCNKADADVRMSLVSLEFSGTDVKTTGRAKIIKKS